MLPQPGNRAMLVEGRYGGGISTDRKHCHRILAGSSARILAERVCAYRTVGFSGVGPLPVSWMQSVTRLSAWCAPLTFCSTRGALIAYEKLGRGFVYFGHRGETHSHRDAARSGYCRMVASWPRRPCEYGTARRLVRCWTQSQTRSPSHPSLSEA